MKTIVIVGAGNIGQAAYQILKPLCGVDRSSASMAKTIADVVNQIYRAENVFQDYKLEIWDKFQTIPSVKVMDFDNLSLDEFSAALKNSAASFVVNALPFFMNEKVAKAAVNAGCSYIDFTEDDAMAEKVQSIFSSSNLTCAVKCGLAPGFINYVGHDLASKIDSPQRLMISVGALPRAVAFDQNDPASNYNLSWSVDGLVNEYIRPCNVRMNGQELQVKPLTCLENIFIDGQPYEAALTSGGIGSLVKELKHIPNVYYKTLRYPGHYRYVADVVSRHREDFDSIKKEFLTKFPFNADDVIVVYAECVGKMKPGNYLKKEVFAKKFKGTNGLSAIQATTAGGALSVLELILKGNLKGIINHKDVPLGMFLNTEIYSSSYFS